MKLSVRFEDYCASADAYMNEPLTLDIALQAFGVKGSLEKSDDILIGHLVDYLAQEFQPNDAVDCLDVAISCLELGFEPASAFLDASPYILRDLMEEDAGLNKVS